MEKVWSDKELLEARLAKIEEQEEMAMQLDASRQLEEGLMAVFEGNEPSEDSHDGRNGDYE
jgi:hypothetical protein